MLDRSVDLELTQSDVVPIVQPHLGRSHQTSIFISSSSNATKWVQSHYHEPPRSLQESYSNQTNPV